MSCSRRASIPPFCRLYHIRIACKESLMGDRKIVKTTCKGCHGGCGGLVTVEDGVIVHVEGNPESVTDGTMCAKGLSQLQHINNPYRIKYPMKRVGAKGEGKWQRITWDEALDTIAKKVTDAK